MSTTDVTVTDPSAVGVDEAALARLDAAIQRDIDAKLNYGASIIVARGGRIAHRKTFGTVGPDRAAADDVVDGLAGMPEEPAQQLVGGQPVGHLRRRARRVDDGA